MQDASNHRLDNTSTPVMDTNDPYPWLEFGDPRRFQTDREILELAVDLSQSCLTKTQQAEFMDVLEKYKDAFCLCDEIGLVPSMEVHLDLVHKTPFFIRPFTVKQDMKQKIDKEMDRLVHLGILKRVYQDILVQPWQFPGKIVTYLELLVISDASIKG